MSHDSRVINYHSLSLGYCLGFGTKIGDIVIGVGGNILYIICNRASSNMSTKTMVFVDIFVT